MFSTRYYIAMTKAPSPDLRALIDRVARLATADAWSDQLNPTQLAALDYLARANRFSRAPSHVAEYLGATRGTVSQTLKSLEKKGFVAEHRSTTDKRRTSYGVTEAGTAAMSGTSDISKVLTALPKSSQDALARGLHEVLTGLLEQRGGRSFGICQSCKFHQMSAKGAHCQLLDVGLAAEEIGQLCHEHAA